MREIVEGMRDVSGLDFPSDVEGRRAGDPPMLIGDASRIVEDLGWQAQFGVEDILQSAWDAWQEGPRRIEGQFPKA